MTKKVNKHGFTTCIFFPDSFHDLFKEAETATAEMTPVEMAKKGIEFLDARLSEFEASKGDDKVGIVNAFTVTIPTNGMQFLTGQTAIYLGAVLPSENFHKCFVYFLVNVFGVLQIRRYSINSSGLQDVERQLRLGITVGMTMCSLPPNLVIPEAWMGAFLLPIQKVGN